ncbi:MAG: hypothetical protein SF051_06430 [Elusimicrobiota bacterium]|nr:hypothetical protein [Elusimicrobiota bacterium]
MTKKTTLAAVFAVSLLASAAAAAVPEGSFRGTTPQLRGGDVMALIVRRDPADARKGYAILSEYTRVPFIPGPERIEITRWVPRMYAFRVEETAEGRFDFKPLRVGASGVEVDGGYAHFGRLTLSRGRMDGATLTRYDRGSVMVAETIIFDGRVSSTWEGFVAGDFFGSQDPTGGDYFHKAVNATLGEDRVATFSQPEIEGRFQMTEVAPFIWTLTPLGQVKGADRVTTRIGVFIDIVNWKPFFTTNEFLLINPDDARDVGFYYQRH